jgi:lipopolysaccharide assembly outer membrane protein LptD (OstA)
MFEKHSLLTNFAWLRRLHLSFLLPGVLVYVVLLHATVNSTYAQAAENQAPSEGIIQMPSNQAPSEGIIQIPNNQAPTKVNIQPTTGVVWHNIITWSGNVEFRYDPQKINATAEKAEYYQSEQKVVLTGSVKVEQAGQLREAETVTFFVESEFKITADKLAMPYK